jgi:monoamine oxidase
MSRTPLFAHIRHILRLAAYCEREKISTAEGLERVARSESERQSRRQFLEASGIVAGGLAAGCALDTGDPIGSVRLGASRAADVGVVGAGFAGLCCADELARWGIAANVYEAADRVGGRCWSLSGVFPGQVAERGGELIDNLHKTLLGYVGKFGLTLENMKKQPGETFYHFGGQHYTESAVVDEYRAFVPSMRADLKRLSPPTADGFTDDDRALDHTNLKEYLESRGAGPIIKAALDVAYNIEYGLETEQQSCLNLLLFIHADKRSRFQPFGVFSDERYHVVEGNQEIANRIAQQLPRPVMLGRRLVRVRKLSDGRIELSFRVGNRTETVAHDSVVLTLPFSVLREVELDPSLGLPDWKRYAIQNLRYGTNSKLMLGFDGRPWRALGSNGVAYADLPNLQNTWETNFSRATSTRAILTDYTGGQLGASLDPKRAQQNAEAFLTDLDKVYPGAKAQARRDAKGALALHLEHWPSNPLSKGSYTCNHPGYFTTICDNEMKRVQNLHFAGEHTSSFYEWQGFMEGAALSGIRAANEILASSK